MGQIAIIGTDKGGFVLRANRERSSWAIEGPFFKGWKVTTSTRDARGHFFVGTASYVYGAALHTRADLADLADWKQIVDGPQWSAESERKLNQIWTLGQGPDGRLWAGVDQAGLFVSEDQGETWRPVEGLNEHPTRAGWFPGAGGLCAHALCFDPLNDQRIWCGISAVGVFRTDDGGATWSIKNEGIAIVNEDEEHKDVGRCVHGLTLDPETPDHLWRREHTGMFRSRDAGDTWERIENGLASWFGFPIALDRGTKELYVIPLESDEYRLPVEGKLGVYKSTDGGDSWQAKTRGLPQEHAWTGVLRGALDVDHAAPCGVLFGTTSGELYSSNDAGESWSRLPCSLPRIMSVRLYADA